MISWMQKHNKYLVWTIWIATIAFIGAGFVGWGSYSFGSKAGNIAKVGNVNIKQDQLNISYRNLYNRYNQMFQGTLDEKKAKEMGLVQQAFSNLEVEARLLNYAQDFGIIASDEELASKLGEIKGFQKDGKFNKDIYKTYLTSQNIKAKDFEKTLKNEIIIQKTLALLKTDATSLEIDTISSPMHIADKFLYKVLNESDINYTTNTEKVRALWEEEKDNYKTKKTYTLSILWTSNDDVNLTDKEIKTYYDTNSFNYTNTEGKQLDFDKAKENVIKDLKLKKTKKSAQKAFIAFKKGEKNSSETITLPVGDMKLTKEIWNTLQTKTIGDILKPKIIGDRYATIKIDEVIEPRIKTFPEAKEEVTLQYNTQAKKDALFNLAKNTLKTINTSNANTSDFVTLNDSVNLNPLNSQESLQFLQKLFTSNKENGIISVTDKVIVYSIIDQKFLSKDENVTETLKKSVNNIKNKLFESNLIKILESKYPTEVYVKGLIN